jgi:hypothetical protein
MRATAVLALALVMVATGCGDPALQTERGETAATATSSTSTTTTTSPEAALTDCRRETVAGCTMLGLRVDPPLPLADALAVAAAEGGTSIAVYRTDAVCVPDVSFSLGEDPEQVASRFAYVDAPEIARRRQEASGQGLAPPISGFHISQSYWDSWNAEWRAARSPGVLIEGVAVWIDADAAITDPAVAEVVGLRWRRTDSIDASYSGELLMESEAFPGLSEAAPIDCSGG